ncbi:hypothetical protein DEJ50_08390 [Streptomyces venezuelae]|uniref:Uncharacterized protein n=1 Tax=Streptomyces venezuelae TaxID=54571 RepID=A0A5P2CY81_STRVZ|nr:hypothetical protein [Streptomyces venezuelae]QES47825.1 hypothetical protein DEJ50_08390 [Streptomyces venezuelae]
MGQKATEKKKLDLSVTQVAGTSLATVAAALLASKLGVYGTILGAGVVSVVATAGGPVIQHLFRRTGDQLREAAAPKGRQVPVPAEPGPPAVGEFSPATTHGSRNRGWKRSAVAAGLAFALAMGGIGAYEAFAGSPVSSDGRSVLPGGPVKSRAGEGDKGDKGDDGSGGGRQGREERSGNPETGTADTDGTDGTAGTDGTRRHSTGPTPPDPDPDPTPPTPAPTPTPTPTPPGPTPAPTPPPTPGPAAPGGDTGRGAGSERGLESTS